MKINSVQRDVALNQGNLMLHSESTKFREKNGAGKNVRGYNASYSGSFTGSGAAANGIKKSLADKVLSKKWFAKFSEYSNDHNISTSALAALVLAGIMRPATIMALPGKDDRDDKIYASGHAIASGIMGFVISTLLTSPFDESIKKYFKDPDKYAPKKSGGKSNKKQPVTLSRLKKVQKYLDEKLEGATTSKFYAPLRKRIKSQIGTMETFAKNIPEWIIAVPRATLTIALIPPILKYVFGMEKKKKQNQEPQMNNQQFQTMNFIDKPIYKDFVGGVK